MNLKKYKTTFELDNYEFLKYKNSQIIKNNFTNKIIDKRNDKDLFNFVCNLCLNRINK